MFDKLENRIEYLKNNTISLSAKKICEEYQEKLKDLRGMVMTPGALREAEFGLLEKMLVQLKPINDTEVKRFVERENRYLAVHNLGIKKAIQKIKESDISAYPLISYTLMQFEKNDLPECLIAENFCAKLKAFQWHPVVNECIQNIEKKLNKYKEDVIIYKTIHEMKYSGTAYILAAVNEQLNEYLLTRTKTSKNKLLEKLSKFNFDGRIRNLANFLRETGDNIFSVKTVPGAVEVDRVFSPVLVKERSEVFGIGGKLYEKEGNNIKILNKENVQKENPEFVKLVEFLGSENVKVSDDVVNVYYKNKKYVITNEGIKVDEKCFNESEFTKIFLKSGFVRGPQLFLLENILNTYRNLDKIVEIEFAKSFKMPLIGRRVDIIKLNENIYLSKEDGYTGEFEFFKKLNAIKTRKLVLEYLNYDILETFREEIFAEEAKLKKIQEIKKNYIESIAKLENKLENVKAIDDNKIKESKEYKEILNVLEKEITQLKKEYSKYCAQEYRLQEALSDKFTDFEDEPGEEESGNDMENLDMENVEPGAKVYYPLYDKYGTVIAVKGDEAEVVFDDGDWVIIDIDNIEIVPNIKDETEPEEVETLNVGDKVSLVSTGEKGVILGSYNELEYIILLDNGQIKKDLKINLELIEPKKVALQNPGTSIDDLSAQTDGKSVEIKE